MILVKNKYFAAKENISFDKLKQLLERDNSLYENVQNQVEGIGSYLGKTTTEKLLK